MISRWLLRFLFLLCACGPVFAQTLLFKSGFETGTTLGPVTGTAPTGPEQTISGTDTSTGFTWPITSFSPNPGLDGIHIVPPHTATDANSLHFFNSLDTSTAHSGSKSLNLNMQGYADLSCCAQNVLNMVGMTQPINSLYQRVWVKLGPEVATQIAAHPSNFWRDLFEIKTSSDFRIITYVYKNNASSSPYFFVQSDNGALNSPTQTFWQSTCLPANGCSVAVPLNQWFLEEIYLKRSSGTDGQFYFAINGQTVVNKTGPNYGGSISSQNIFQWMIQNEYGEYFPMQEWLDDLELWDTPPCGTLPCGSSGTSPNTAPTITSTSPLAAGTVGAAYLQTLTASGSAPVTWGITSGTLPTGLSLNSSTGAISGTPSAAGTSTFTAQATNAVGNNTKSFSLSIAAAPPVISISSFSASPSSINVGASSTLSWATTGATVLSIDNGIGAVTGSSKSVTPTGTTTYKLTATNSGGSVSATATVNVTIGGTVAPPQTPALPNVPTDSDLLVAADHCDTTLSADITNSTLSFPVASLSTCVPNQVLFVDSEQVKNCSGASNVFTICSSGRGFAGTTAATHAQGARVRGRIGAVYHNQIVQEYIAFQTWLAGQTHHGTYPGGTSIGGACWPNHICTLNELYAASDFAESTLSAAIGSSDTSLTVAASSSYQASQVVLVGQELIKVGSVSGTTLSGLTRGIGGTTSAQHATGASVVGVIAAFEFERLKLELHAMEADVYGTAGSTQVGICGTSCAAVPGVSWPNHVFDPSEAGTAANGGPFPALWRNRLKDEIKAFSADLSAHP